MENNRTFGQKISSFFKRFGYYIVLGTLLFIVALTFIFVATSSNSNEPIVEQTSSTVSPFMPVLNASIYKGYYGDELMYNATLKQWETHNGIDFVAASGSKVYSILDGKVTKVYSNALDGNVVVVDHGNGLTSSYASLDSELNVSVGDSVDRGQVLGCVSSSSSAEADAGAHLHFSLEDNGKKIDPESYLNIATK